MVSISGNLWGLVLAGGDGERLKDFVRTRLNSERPKQFCTFHGTRSMLGNTLERVRRQIAPQRIIVSINSRHIDFARPDLGDLSEDNIIIQPENKDTGPGILFPLLHLHRRDPGSTVCVLPADHLIRPEALFMDQIESAVRYVEVHTEDLLLLGAEAHYPETDYGWIEPGGIIAISDGREILGVRNFWEKPNFEKAQELADSGCLWNTMVMVGKVRTFLERLRQVTPHLYHSFLPVMKSLGSPLEKEIARAVYASVPRTNFSTTVLQREMAHLVVMPARGVHWSDWGRGERIEMDLALMSAQHTSTLNPRIAREQIPNISLRQGRHREAPGAN